MINNRLRVVSNFGDSGEIRSRARENGLPRGDALRGASLRGSPFRVHFAGIAKIRDYSQSRSTTTTLLVFVLQEHFNLLLPYRSSSGHAEDKFSFSKY